MRSPTHPHPHDHPHEHPHEHPHPHAPPAVDRRTLLRAGGWGLGAILLAACGAPRSAPTAVPTTDRPAGSAGTTASDGSLAGFDAFASTVRTFAQGGSWMVESTGLPTHDMMRGITSWQQQVPLPQRYTGANAWRFPVTPALAEVPISAKHALFRGAIAIAVNGVPIFNALNNRGDDAYLAGELDEWGGHAGRADDYHYHVAPLHLQAAVGASHPIAYALDGFAIYGETEPDGSPVTALDEYNGHVSPDGGYHYHGTRTYPYLNGGLRGVVEVRNDQVEPQPATTPIRPAGAPLRGATITAFSSPATGAYLLEYAVDGRDQQLAYEVQDTSVRFTFTDTTGATRTETYAR